MKDLVIINPQFITDLLSSIITTKHTFVKDGLLTHRSLEHIWRDPVAFPPALHAPFLALLEKFEISFPLEAKRKHIQGIDFDGRSLIPCLLSRDVPKGTFDYLSTVIKHPGGKQMNRYIELDFIPSGTLSSFGDLTD